MAAVLLFLYNYVIRENFDRFQLLVQSDLKIQTLLYDINYSWKNNI